jgi:acetyl-CoA carboxylase biotin carboxyl carrier protein
MNLNQLKKVIKIFESSSLSELEIEEGKTRFRLTKGRREKSAIAEGKSVAVIENKRVEEKRKKKKEEKKLFSVNSPLVGTFYRSPSPEDEPFAEVGDRVEVGDTLCIIEAMKVMNEITSDVEGKIKEITVKNGHPVEYDQELFLIEEGE